LINSVTVDHFNVPTPTALTDSMHGEIRSFGLVIARIKADSGEEGVGYITIPNNVAAGAVASLITRDLGPSLIGQSPERTELIWNQMAKLMRSIGRSGLVSRAMSVLDIAVWDLKAKVYKKPLWRLLGASKDSVKVVAAGVDLMLPLKDLIRQTEKFLTDGFLAIKIKVGRREMKEDIQRVRAVRAFLDNYAFEIGGQRLPLMVSADGEWSLPQAVKALALLEKHSIEWVEMPIMSDDVNGYKKLYNTSIIAVAAGSTVTTEQEVMHLICEGKLSIAQIGVNNIGGITPFMKAARLAEIHKIPVTTQGPHDIHFHLVAALDNATFCEVSEFRLNEFIDLPLTIVNGKAKLSDVPGHGVRFDFKALEKHRDSTNVKTTTAQRSSRGKLTMEEATAMTKKLPKDPWDMKMRDNV